MKRWPYVRFDERYAHDLGGDDVAAEKHGDPMYRSHELGLAGAPAHTPGDWQRVEGCLDDARQQIDGARA
jgi:hypothetical protein